jgi:NADH-quinone oxidoreductase subunit L
LGFPRSLAELIGIHANTNRFEHFLDPVFSPAARQMKAQGETAMLEAGKEEAAHHDPVEYLLMVLSVGVAVGAGFMAWRVYGRAGKDYREPIAEKVPPVYNALYNKYYVDEAYDAVFVGGRTVGPVRLGAMGLGEAARHFDANVVDGMVNGAGWGTRLWSSISIWWDKWIIDGLLVNGIAIFTRALSYPVRLVQWGLVQWYALVMVAGLVAFVAYYMLR